ncbi:hypothetical protein CMV_007114 [Castanea mollissima]|uniref:Hydroxyproline-rich glycoprotein family protein n=1 Tax=Castanea mollissima TaxID=60419 RepID=A0A8J4W336_9ROSI|nr:hypothetical protein CMV_007114 [Castanea mollissima]
MRRNGDSRALNNALETISAAATVIATTENRVPQDTVQKRRWGSCLSLYWCFGYTKHRKRIGHAVLVPETMAPRADVSAAENPIQAPALVLPFVAPPSSPASFLQSEPPSAAQSPVGILSLTSISANMYSPAFTTEPSTAPFTPPPESVHLTTPSSPEVPFAQLLDPNLRNGSGTSSPFPDHEFAGGGPLIVEFRTGDPPKLLNFEKLSNHEWGSRHGSGSLTPDAVRPTSRDSFLLNRQMSEVILHSRPDKGRRDNGIAVNHRVSFELSTEDVVKCVGKNSLPLAEAVSASLKDAATAEGSNATDEIVECNECRVGETSNDAPEKAPADGEEVERHQKHRSITLGSAKEFNFDNRDGGDSCKPNVVSDWWANEKVVGKEGVPTKDWSFFPMMQPGVS